MANNILIVPDVHGRDFWVPALDFQGEIVFLGDYTDPYPVEGYTDEDAYQGLLKIIKFKQENLNRVTLLIGNHELHYYNKYMACGRFCRDYFEKFNNVLTSEENKNLFQICKQIDNYLFIHSGIIKVWYDLHYKDFEDCGTTLEERLNNVFFKKMNIFYEAARKYRGGLDDAGSPLWSDVHELIDEEEHFDPNIFQIIGHTQILEDTPIIKEHFAMLDNRLLYILRNDVIEKY